MRMSFLRRALASTLPLILVIGCGGTAAPASPTQAVSSPTPAPPVALATPAAVPVAVTSPRPSGASRPIGQTRFELDPGTYRYAESFPSVTFTVPTGWGVTESMPRHFGLRPAAFTADNSVRIWYDMRVASRDPSCPEASDPAFGHTAGDLLRAFRTRPGIDPRQAVPITLGGLDGYRTDLRIDEDWTEPCPFTDGQPATTLFIDDGTTDDPAFWGLAGYDEQIRVIVLDDGAGSNIVITIDAVDGPTFDALVAAAMPVLETFDFEG